MKHKLLTLLFIFASVMMSAQTENPTGAIDSLNTVKPQEESIYTYVEQMPQFPGGENALMSYLARNIVYPKMAIDSGIQGKVIVDFVVRKDGSISNAKIIKGVGLGCDEEALRVVNAMPHWYPGKQHGRPENVAYRVPIKFTLK